MSDTDILEQVSGNQLLALSEFAKTKEADLCFVDGLVIDNPFQAALDEILALRKQLADLTGTVCGDCDGESLLPRDTEVYGLDCKTCQGTGRIKTHVIVPLEPTEGMLNAAGPMEGFDCDIYEGDIDRPHIEWWKAMIGLVNQGEAP